jgi:3-deoxy-D-manno-octulosonate 8-phosphate phosphatase (KDO 8-P phosphatase)
MTDWKKIRAFTFDIDGVLTDGTLLAVGDGEYVRRFNVKDNFAIRAALMYGYKIGVFTGGFGEGITDRMRTASVPEEDVYMRCRGKIKVWEDFCAKHGLKPEEVLYIGDDIPDLQIMRVAGIGAAPADAAVDVLEEADYVCETAGGQGCMRELVEKVLRASGKWNFPDEVFEKIF